MMKISKKTLLLMAAGGIGGMALVPPEAERAILSVVPFAEKFRDGCDEFREHVIDVAIKIGLLPERQCGLCGLG